MPDPTVASLGAGSESGVLRPELYRETGDADVGVPPIVVRDHHLLERLKDRGCEQVEGNRFARTMADGLDGRVRNAA